MTITHLPELAANQAARAAAERRPAARAENVARALLQAFGEPSPEQRFATEGRGSGVRDALATAVMDCFRKTGDPEAFEALVGLARRPLAERVRVRLRVLGLSLDPDEVLQDTLVNVFRYPDRFDGAKPGAFRAWSSTIVDNVIRRQLRQARSGPDVQLRTDEQLCLQPDVRACEPSVRAEHGEACEAAQRAIGLLLGCYLEAYHALTERERFVLQMVEVKGMRYAELAGVLGIRPEALKMVVFRARRRIHERLTVMFSRAATGAG
jgi:RNA polymerase sigma-70 factor (ECF subfamily)